MAAETIVALSSLMDSHSLRRPLDPCRRARKIAPLSQHGHEPDGSTVDSARACCLKLRQTRLGWLKTATTDHIIRRHATHALGPVFAAFRTAAGSGECSGSRAEARQP